MNAERSLTVAIMCVGPWWIPGWVWRVICFAPWLTVGGQEIKLKWSRTVELALPADVDVDLGYPAGSWGIGSLITFRPKDGDRIVYQVSIWPWVKGKIYDHDGKRCLPVHEQA